MKKVDAHANETIRKLCRDINQRADDRDRLQTLVVRLQQALREPHETRVMKVTASGENPFDKIMVQ